MTDDNKAEAEGGNASESPDPPPPIEDQNGTNNGGPGGGQGPRDDKRNGALAFLSDLETSEKLTAFLAFCTLVVGVGSLVVAFLAYQTAADTRDIKRAIGHLSDLADATKRQADLTADAIGDNQSIANEANRRTDAAIRMAGGQLTEMHTEQRPRIAVLSAVAASPLYFDNTGAHITITFSLKNNGRSDALYVYPFAEFFVRSWGEARTTMLRQDKYCAAVRRRRGPMASVGTDISPGETTSENSVLTMTPSDVERWKKFGYVPDNSLIVTAMVVGCADYIFDGKHHQTTFVYELDRRRDGPNPFAAIDVRDGKAVQQNELVLPVNPGLAGKSD